MTLLQLTAYLREAGLWRVDEPLPITLSVAEYHRITGEGIRSIYKDCRTGRIPHRKAGARNFVRILTIPALSLFFDGAGTPVLPEDQEPQTLQKPGRPLLTPVAPERSLCTATDFESSEI